LNLYVKNLDDDVDDARLGEIFSEFGPITSSVVMKDERNVSRGFGFVCFENESNADKALNGMRSKSIGKKPLFVARAQRKEERRMLLENEFQTSMVQRMQYSQLFYPPAVPVPQPGMFYPPQMYQRRVQMPMRNAGYTAQPAAQHLAAYTTQVKRGRGGYYAQSRGGPSQNRSGPRPTRVNQIRNHQPPVTPAPILPSSSQGRDLASVLASEPSSARQKNMLGERLFPLIQKDHPALAGKITGCCWKWKYLRF